MIEWNIVEFAALSFFVWRLTYMVVEESGPYKLLEKARSPFFVIVKTPVEELRKPKNIIGELIECFYCTSFWISLLAILYERPTSPVLYWIACSGTAILIEEFRRKLT